MAQILREIGSNVGKTRASLAEAKKDLQHIQTLQKGLEDILTGLWRTDVQTLSTSPPVWKELVAVVASGKIVTVSAQAEEAQSAGRYIHEKTWLADGRAYSRWAGNGVAVLARGRDVRDGDLKTWSPISDLCARSFGIGYADEVVDTIVSSLVLEQECEAERLQFLVRYLARHEQRQFVTSLLHFISKRLLPKPLLSQQQANGGTKDEEAKIAACAALLKQTSEVNEPLVSEHLASWLAKGPSASVGICRVIISALSNEARETLLEKVWQTFSDKLYIKHTPVTQQEALLRVLLLCAGAVHRTTPMQVYMLAHASFHSAGISDRLGSTSSRARFLGMALGTAISQLVDKPETRMTFDFDDSEKEELTYFQSLLRIHFKVGSIADLRSQSRPKAEALPLVKRPKPVQKPKTQSKAVAPKIAVIEDDEDADLTPMAKPDSDASDSDPDPTVARRDQPKAPVYIRDALTQLQSTDDHDAHLLTLRTLPSLIRRKATFGTELADQAPLLAGAYALLQDPLHLPDFHDLKLAGMVAMLVALPQELGPWFASAVWGGEYNISQRVGMLTAMGLAGRELAGYGRDGDPRDSKEDFPSERLPERLHRMYTADDQITTLAKRLESSAALTPTTATATATTRKKPRPRTKLIKNDLSKIVANSFSLPLTSAYRETSGVGGANSKHVLPTLLSTLSLLLTLCASSTIALPTITAEYWALLLSVRTRAPSDPQLLEALLFGLLSIFEAYKERRRELAESFAGLVVETMRWVEVVFEKLEGAVGSGGLAGLGSGGDGNGREGIGLGMGMGRDDQGQRCRMLAAGVLMAAKEVVETYQRLLVGELA